MTWKEENNEGAVAHLTWGALDLRRGQDKRLTLPDRRARARVYLSTGRYMWAWLELDERQRNALLDLFWPMPVKAPDPDAVAEVYTTALALAERMGMGRGVRILRCLRSWHALESSQRAAVLALCWPVSAWPGT